MNIDFHFGVIYLVGRLAGLDITQATIVAHACQYVDDSTVAGPLNFQEGQSFDRFASAHKLVDYRNYAANSDKRVWAPFHFLPSGEGNTFEEKCVCRPNSRVAQDMVRLAIAQRDAKNGLHRMVITLHVYVDTWAHQGFTGTLSPYNSVRDLSSEDHPRESLLTRLRDCMQAAITVTESDLMDLLPRLGHGAALHLPDLPWAAWRYINGHNRLVERINLPDYVTAADMAHKAIAGFLSGCADYLDGPGLSQEARGALSELLGACRDDDPDQRLQALRVAASNGIIPGVREPIPDYIPKGRGSWKHMATGIVSKDDDGDQTPVWSQVFEESDYRKFHDAVRAHRVAVTEMILPAYGVRLA